MFTGHLKPLLNMLTVGPSRKHDSHKTPITKTPFLASVSILWSNKMCDRTFWMVGIVRPGYTLGHLSLRTDWVRTQRPWWRKHELVIPAATTEGGARGAKQSGGVRWLRNAMLSCNVTMSRVYLIVHTTKQHCL